MNSESVALAQDGSHYYQVAGPYVDPKSGEFNSEGTFAILPDTLHEICGRGQSVAIAHFYKLVLPGLILTDHIFQGLDRPLFCDGTYEGDQDKLVYARKAAWDYEWEGGRTGKPVRGPAPADSVFVVYISRNTLHKESFPMVDGWIERWCWIQEDQGLRAAPIGWVDRYSRKLWTRVEQ